MILDYFWVIFEVKPFWSEDKLLFSGFLGLRGLGRVWSHKTQIMHFKIFGLSDYHKNLLDASFCNGILDDGRKTLSPPLDGRAGWMHFNNFFWKSGLEEIFWTLEGLIGKGWSIFEGVGFRVVIDSNHKFYFISFRILIWLTFYVQTEKCWIIF